MEERLKNFVTANKREFDEAEPPFGVWEKIEKKLDAKKLLAVKNARVVRLSLFFKLVASITIVVAAGIFLWQYQYRQATDLANIDPALAKQQLNYASEIELKVNKLKSLENVEPQLYNEFSSEIKKMEESYQKLENDLPNSPNQEETVKAMIRNLQIQTEVLNQQLNVIKQINDSKNQQNEAQSI